MRALRLRVFLRHPRQGFRIDVNAGRKLSAGFRTPDKQHAHGLRPSLPALGLCDLGQPAKLQRGERSDQQEDSESSDDFKAEHFSLRGSGSLSTIQNSLPGIRRCAAFRRPLRGSLSSVCAV
jgi:hypothetical protein